MNALRTHVRRLRRVRAWHAAPLIALLALGLSAWPAAGGNDPRPWPAGRLTYFDASGSSQAVDAAARRWNESGARVHLTRARTRVSADVVFVADRKRLRGSCGARCLGLSSSIGRPRSGRVTVGLRHREGTCSLMNAQAYDDACTFTGSSGQGPLPCGPASGDVAAAARLYGRDTAARPCR
jgi:hypothetical protein